MPYDLLIRGDDRDVAIEDGRIAAFEPGPARAEIDARGLLVLPGAIDAHVHFNEPGRTDWEGWATGTRALAAGGATACIEMPLNAHPPTVDRAAFDAMLAAARRAALVDFALWGGLIPGAELEALAERGVAGFKAFMCDSGIADFPAADPDTLHDGMARAAALGLPVAVHAESPAHLRAPAGPGWRDWVASRPAEAELHAIATALALAEETRCSLHVVHVSTGRGVALVAEARARGVDATCETCPHYLVLTEDDLETLGTRAKCAPPLRPAAERDALRGRLGDIAFIASDHSPSPPAMKAAGFDAAWGGISGCQYLLPLMIDAGVPDVDRLVSINVAERFRLPKGFAPGADADLVLVDTRAPHAAAPEDRHRSSPFAGRRLRARVARTIVRGRTVYAGGRIVAAPPFGRLITPARRSAC